MLIVVLAALAVSCSGDEDSTTTTIAAAATNDTSQASATTEAGTGAQSPQPPQGPPQTPPSIAQGQTMPPQPGQEYAEKLPGLEQAVQGDPENLGSLAELAIAYYQTQSYVKAEETYKKMIAIEDRAEFHNNLANVYRDWQKSDLAVEQYEEAIELDPASALPYGNLAAMYLMNGETEKAKEIAETGVENTSGAGRDQLEALLARMQ